MATSSLSLCTSCLTRLQVARAWQRATSPFQNLQSLHAPPTNLRTKVHTRYIHSQEFRPFVPPSPDSLPKPAPPKTYRRTRRWTRRLLYLALGLGIAHEVDKHFLYSSLMRSARTFWLGLLVGTDYKINFRAHPPLAESIQALHNRNAERLFNLLRTNGGLYLKIGQAIAMQVNTGCCIQFRPQEAEVSLVGHPAPRISEDVCLDVRRCSSKRLDRCRKSNT